MTPDYKRGYASAVRDARGAVRKIGDREDEKARELWRKDGEWKHRYASEIAEEIEGDISALLPPDTE